MMITTTTAPMATAMSSEPRFCIALLLVDVSANGGDQSRADSHEGVGHKEQRTQRRNEQIHRGLLEHRSCERATTRARQELPDGRRHSDHGHLNKQQPDHQADGRSDLIATLAPTPTPIAAHRAAAAAPPSSSCAKSPALRPVWIPRAASPAAPTPMAIASATSPNAAPAITLATTLAAITRLRFGIASSVGRIMLWSAVTASRRPPGGALPAHHRS